MNKIDPSWEARIKKYGKVKAKAMLKEAAQKGGAVVKKVWEDHKKQSENNTQ